MENAQRNQRGRLVIDKNKTTNAEIQVRVLDERFLMQDFTYIVDINFKSLKNAVTAENYVLSVLDLVNGNILNEINFEGDIESNLNLTEIPTIETFLSDIGNLINKDPDSISAQKNTINRLQQEIEDLKLQSNIKNEEIYQQTENLINANITIQEKEKQIEDLKDSINSLIDEMTNE